MKRALGALTPWDTFHRMTEYYDYTGVVGP